MIPKIIHLCWFSGESYPVEIKICLASWRRVLPDYEVRLWDCAAARAIGMPYIDEALEAKRWAFAADAVRFYALYTEGGVYMDSDIFLYKRFDEFLPKEDDMFVTFLENYNEDFAHCETVANPKRCGLQAAFGIATKGSTFCKEMLDYYAARHYALPDGSRDDTISPHIMKELAIRHGWQHLERPQRLDCLTTYPTRHLAPKKNWPRLPETFARHTIYGSWRHRKWNRKVERFAKHCLLTVRYFLFRK